MTTSTSTAPSALVVVPTYNEHENLPLLVDGLMRHANLRLLVMDDQSPDGTGQLADELARQHQGRISVLHRTKNRGLGRSYIDGLKLAIREPVDVICQMDADLSHDPKYLPALVDATTHFDLVIGSRYLGDRVSVVNWPIHRIMLSAFANRYIRIVTGLSPSDCTSGFRCWRRGTRKTGEAFLDVGNNRTVIDRPGSGHDHARAAIVARQVGTQARRVE
jgi:dolichol-phosphate mannosyltransferase